MYSVYFYKNTYIFYIGYNYTEKVRKHFSHTKTILIHIVFILGNTNDSAF